jgi:exodeoxyribonuclease VII small subunit
MTKDQENNETKNVSFDEAFEELEEITKSFEEQDEVDLDEGLDKFERGLKLAQLCKEKLSKVENRVKELKDKYEEE